MTRIRPLRWFFARAVLLCVLLAGWLWWQRPSEDRRGKGVAAAVQRVLADDHRAGTKQASAPAADSGLRISPLHGELLALQKAGKLDQAAEIMTMLVKEPNHEKWADGLYQLLILNHEDPSFGNYLWIQWKSGAYMHLPAATLLAHIENLPAYLVNQFQDARVGHAGEGDRRLLAELVRTLRTKLEEGNPAGREPLFLNSAPNPLRALVLASRLADGVMSGQDGSFIRAVDTGSHISPSLARLVELEVIDRLRAQGDPDKLLGFALERAEHLTRDDPELRAATSREGFFYGPERRIDRVLAAPPSTARDILLASAAMTKGLAAEERSRLTAAITDEISQVGTKIELMLEKTDDAIPAPP